MDAMKLVRQNVLDRLREQIAELPTEPGVYLFKDAGGIVLYVGKAKSLRSRVASYFQPSAKLAQSRGLDIERMIRELVCGRRIGYFQSAEQISFYFTVRLRCTHRHFIIVVP